MAYELSFTPDFFIGPHDLEGGVPHDKERPTSVYQAILAMSDEDFEEMARDVFGCDPDFVDVDMVLSKIEETNTCRNLSSPVEVYIDEEGWWCVLVFDTADE